MKPIAIIQNAATEGPGHFATYLERHSLPSRLYRSVNGELPASSGEFSGLVMMGGAMSANDMLPWIPPLLGLIRDALRHDVPVLGHCLGGQLMAKAMGATVYQQPLKEIGWCELAVDDNAEAAKWFGKDTRSFTAFEWHGDAFTLPEGATRLLSSPYCENQAFAAGPHLSMQCHVEMDSELVHAWCEEGAREIAEAGGPAVQSPEEIQRDLQSRLASLNAIADRLYQRWTASLKT